jgi:hypothetical protein
MTFEEKIYIKVLEHDFKTKTLRFPVLNKSVAVRVANLLRRDGFSVEVSWAGSFDFMYLNISPPQTTPPA